VCACAACVCELRSCVNPVTYDILTQRVKQLGNLPAMPTILTTLCEALSARVNKINVGQIARTISYDKSLTAQCLREANSALYRQRGDVATVREAVLSLGLWRIRDIAFSCNLPLLFANLNSGVKKEVFWRHGLGTAVVSQRLAETFCAANHEQAYLAGLLHDIGFLVNAILFPEDFREVMKEAATERASIEAVELRDMGFTHAESGRILAELWRLPVEIADAIEYHMHPEEQVPPNDVTFIVSVADQICRRCGMDYGYEIEGEKPFAYLECWQELSRKFPAADTYSEADATAVLEHFVAEAHALADEVISPALVR
jgi:HD-like signal output (HDOD) protein